MRILILFVLIYTASLSCYCQVPTKYDTKETHALNDVAEKWQRYWNSHNMDSFATLFAADIDFVTKSGTWFKGKEETMNHHRKNHASIFKNSIWATDSVVIKYVKPDLAIIHIGWGLSDDTHHDGTPSEPRHGISTWVLIKQNSLWLLLSVQNVNIETPR
ncbi:MAG TPA: SgcJ/EcaC family oxidoreductase [Chitinophagaceae bacterium]|nr:SgcJ/EcaC family oxidoreductase [Chitinophagaceae bacterium]